MKLDCLERNCLVEYMPFKVLTAGFFGAHVVPPGDLAKLRIGMKLADAKAVAPGPVAARQGLATEVDGVREFVAIDDKLGTVRSIYLNLPPHAEDLIADAWGPGAFAFASASFMPMRSFARSPGGTTCAPKNSDVST